MSDTSPVSLVTGSARGIGHGIARELAERGHRVHVSWKSSKERVEDLESRFPGRVHHADLTFPEEAKRVVAEVLEIDGRLDCLVHAVGDCLFRPLAELNSDELRHLFTNNTFSAFDLFAAARSAVRETGGAAIFFGTAGLENLRARRESAAYTAAKTALLALTRSLALEEAPHGVRINMVSPGIVPHDHAAEETRDPARLGSIPLGRPGEVEDVAHAVAWLLSSEASHVTGQNLDVAGGWML